MKEFMKLSHLLANYMPGDEWSWLEEFEHLQQIHADKIKQLTREIKHVGILHPIDLGPDGRVWNGHHRLYVAVMLNIAHVPVRYKK